MVINQPLSEYTSLWEGMGRIRGKRDAGLRISLDLGKKWWSDVTAHRQTDVLVAPYKITVFPIPQDSSMKKLSIDQYYPVFIYND
jgi:hypothetical protein